MINKRKHIKKFILAAVVLILIFAFYFIPGRNPFVPFFSNTINNTPEILNEIKIVLLNLLPTIKDLILIFGGIIALLNYTAQSKQKKFDNAFALIKKINEDISPKDWFTLREVYINTYESLRAGPGYFVVFTEKGIRQVPIMNLFLPEGTGLVVTDCSLSTDQKPTENIDLGAVREIAENLEIFAYEILHGNIEYRIIHYELGQKIEVICFLLEKSLQMSKEDPYDISARFKYLLRL